MNRMKRILSVALLASMIGCSAPWSKTQAASLAERAEASEERARTTKGSTAALAWYRAGKFWVDPGNEKKSPARALAAFRQVDLSRVNRTIADDTKTWISTLSQLVSAKEAAAESDRARRSAERALGSAERALGDVTR